MNLKGLLVNLIISSPTTTTSLTSNLNTATNKQSTLNYFARRAGLPIRSKIICVSSALGVALRSRMFVEYLQPAKCRKSSVDLPAVDPARPCVGCKQAMCQPLSSKESLG